MLKSFVLAAALAGVLPAAVAQTAFTVNGQFVSVEEQKQLMDFLRANGVTNEKQLKNAARSILLEQKIIEQAARNEGLLEDPRVRVLTSEKQAQLYGSILSRRYASEHPITEEQVRNRYDSLLSSYDPHEIKFRHILVKTPEEAREIIQSLKVGSDFGSLAKRDLWTKVPLKTADRFLLRIFVMSWFRPRRSHPRSSAGRPSAGSFQKQARISRGASRRKT